jgi:hypothetical protein
VANIQSLPLLLKELRLNEISKQWHALSGKAIKEEWEPAQYCNPPIINLSQK